MKTNPLLLLTPKTQLAILDDSMSIRQGLEKMKAHGFSAIPVINHLDGTYLGSISEGDFLWYILANDATKEKLEETKLLKLIKTDKMPAVKVDADINDLLQMVMVQNYVPIVDDRNILMGIVTRRSVLNHLLANDL